MTFSGFSCPSVTAGPKARFLLVVCPSVTAGPTARFLLVVCPSVTAGLASHLLVLCCSLGLSFSEGVVFHLLVVLDGLSVKV